MKPLAQQLFARLREAGVDCTFGIPGDFVLPLYAAQSAAGMRTVVCTHEPSVGFAADAYARLKGLGVAMTTFGAGGLNMVNPVAMAYAEHSPVLVISGAPEVGGRHADLRVHHMVKDFDSQRKVFAEVTVATATLDNPGTALTEVDRVLEAVVTQKRPGYIEIPRDMTNVPAAPSTHRPTGHDGEGNPEALAEALREIRALLSQAKHPVLYAGVGVRRNMLMAQAVRLAEAWSLPVVSSVLGKASFPESHPHYVGVFVGKVGSAAAREAIEQADLVLTVGVINSDVNTGFGTFPIPHAKQIIIDERDTLVFHHRYEHVPMTGMVTALAGLGPDAPRPAPAVRKASAAAPAAPVPRADGALTTDGVIAAVREVEQSSYSFLSDIGDAWFVGLELDADVFMAAGYYATMGFAVPGALGAAVAEPARRPFVIVGDGAFQMTGNELATLARLGVDATVLLLNNNNYKMLEVLDQPREYYHLEPWDYVALGQALGAAGERVTTADELRAALARAETAKGPYLIEAMLDPHDDAPIMRQLKQLTAAARAGA
ncbi:MAG TPA: thiamine pyrophosphate-dependent enzyme [bacterium]|nr:thiamine pyrophosphate-dependent enzyme [bacterium]